MNPMVLTQVATGLSVLAVVKQVMDERSMMGPGGAPRCHNCNGSGRVTCICTRWSDADVGCRTCSGSGRMLCSTCRGTRTGRPISVRVPASRR
ncbi:hypothetical protein ACS0TY_033532 [Phlomoides rotata]